MKCPICKKPAYILATRQRQTFKYRRYKCLNEHRFSTEERLKPVKGDGHGLGTRNTA